jgi:hypothetical protein
VVNFSHYDRERGVVKQERDAIKEQLDTAFREIAELKKQLGK